MVKTDNRHSNNTSANRNLHIELDLWIAFGKNGNSPIKIGEATSKGRFGDNKWVLFYQPSDHAKSLPFLLCFESGGETDSARFETIGSAKYYLKKSDPDARWKNNRQESNENQQP